MQIDALLWILLPVFIAAGSALLSFYMMQARMEVAISKEREVLAEARAEIRTQKSTMEERVKATEQEALFARAQQQVQQHQHEPVAETV